MGGMGSGRWGWHRRQTAVEDGRTLDLGLILRGRVPAAGQAGTLTWSRDGEVRASVGYEVVAAGGGLAVRLSYTWTPRVPPTEPRAITLDVRLEPGSVPNGGSRWWGRCPLAVNGVACGRRVGKLYLPPGSAYFGCRQCHRLTYRSCQEHDPRVTRLLRDPDALLRFARHPERLSVPQLGLALKALTVQQKRDERLFRKFDKRGRGR